MTRGKLHTARVRKQALEKVRTERNQRDEKSIVRITIRKNVRNVRREREKKV